MLYPVYFFCLIILCMVGPYGVVGRSIKRMVLKGFSSIDQNVIDGDVIISKTPPYEYPSAFLKAGINAVSYHFGELKRLDRSFFDYVVSTPSTPAKKPDISLDVMPTGVSYKMFLDHVARYTGRKYYLMLIGGSAKGIKYSRSDWDDIINFVVWQSEVNNIDWVISTSPRTTAKVEAYIESKVSNIHCVRELVLWNMGGRKSIADCLAGAEVVFVTEDSAAMLSDAVNCKLPTISIRPRQSVFNRLTTPLAEYHARRGSIARVITSELQDVSLKRWVDYDFNPVEFCWTESWNE